MQKQMQKQTQKQKQTQTQTQTQAQIPTQTQTPPPSSLPQPALLLRLLRLSNPPPPPPLLLRQPSRLFAWLHLASQRGCALQMSTPPLLPSSKRLTSEATTAVASAVCFPRQRLQR
jgi:hypothetical protein